MIEFMVNINNDTMIIKMMTMLIPLNKIHNLNLAKTDKRMILMKL
jgi:hypothetical protein